MMALTHPYNGAPYKRHFRYLLFSAILILILIGPIKVWAEEVVLTTGEKFTSSKVWQTDDQIRFNMHGLVVTVNRSDVAAIIGDDGTRQQIAAPTPQIEQARSPSPAHRATTPKAPLEKRLQKSAPAATAAQPQSDPRPPGQDKINGPGLESITWLMAPAEISGLEMIDEDLVDGGIEQYWRPNEKMRLGSALLDGMVYGFWHSQLYSIMMWVEGQPGYERLRNTVFSRYGQGRKSSKVMDRFLWIEQTTDRMLEFDHQRNTGFFWMRSRKLDARIKAQNPQG